MASTLAMEEQQLELANRFKYKEGCWFDWLVDEQQCEEKGCDLNEWQRKELANSLASHYKLQQDQKSSCGSEHCADFRRPHSKSSSKGPRVVWCHEHCHKAHNDTRRRDLWRLCHEHGSSMVCVKKAAKLSLSPTSASQASCILITDWREAKPCMDIESIQAGKALLKMIVHCETEQTFCKASKWAATLHLAGVPVYVARSFDEVVEHLLDSLQVPSERSSLPTTPSTLSIESAATPTTACSTDSEFHFSEASDNSAVSAVEIQHQVAYELSTSAMEQAWHFQQVQCSAPYPVMHVLGPVFSVYSTQQLSQALEEAMPECYND